MTKQFYIIAAILALSTSACCMHEHNHERPGTYEKRAAYTDSNGTTVENDTYRDVQVDKHGNKKVVVKSKTTKDPKGLLNKTTTSKSKTVIEDDDNQ